MIQPISDERVFYVTKLDPDGREMYNGVNPIAFGVKVTSSAMASWYDKAAEYMRATHVKKSQMLERNIFLITDDEGYSYRFEFLGKHLYDTVVQQLLAGSPTTLETDDDVQRWLVKPHDGQY